MNKIYRFSTNQYQPISYKDRYLFDCYGSLKQILQSNRFSKSEVDHLAEPNNRNPEWVDWYANFVGEFHPLENLDETVKNEVVREYAEFKNKLKRFADQLKKQGEEGLEWNELIQLLISDEDTILLSNSQDWVMIWGWKFRNFNDYYRIPDFYVPGSDLTLNDTIVDNNSSIQGLQTDEKEEAPVDDLEEVKDQRTIQVGEKFKMKWWHRVLRFLRWLTYRFWLLWILLALFPLLYCLLRWLDFFNCNFWNS